MDLKKKFGNRASSTDLTLQVGKGEICGFLGAKAAADDDDPYALRPARA